MTVILKILAALLVIMGFIDAVILDNPARGAYNVALACWLTLLAMEDS